MSSAIRVLLVEDSPSAQRLVSRAVLHTPELRVVGTTPRGNQAHTMIQRLRPDLVLIGIERPEGDGLAPLTELRRAFPKLKVLAALSANQGSVGAVQVLAQGASGYVSWPSGEETTTAERFGDELRAKVNTIFQAPTPAPRRLKRIELVVVASSTGGPDALAAFVEPLPANFPAPVLVVQHMLPSFTGNLVSRLGSRCRLKVSASREGAVPSAGQLWLAEGGVHLALRLEEGVSRLQHISSPPENSCRPAADVLFRSAAQCHGGNVLAIVLTGMGYDGLRGAQELQKVGAEIWAQDEASSVVWGMPGAIVQAGLASTIQTPAELGARLARRAIEERLAAR